MVVNKKKKQKTIKKKKHKIERYTFIPISIGDKRENGTCLVANSHNKIAKLHMSHASELVSLRFLCKARIN